jgi:hypothetical protein
MTEPLGPKRLAEIRADLDAVPAPPWRWIGVRGSGGPQLVTDHSGQQYLLRAKKPVDGGGDEVLDFVTDAPVYGDLEFRDQRPGETYSTMRTGDQMAIGRTDYDPDAIVGVDNPVARWVERSASHAAALLAEVEWLMAELASQVRYAATLETTNTCTAPTARSPRSRWTACTPLRRVSRGERVRAGCAAGAGPVRRVLRVLRGHRARDAGRDVVPRVGR